VVPASRVAAGADPSGALARADERSAPVVSGVGAIISLTMMLAEIFGFALVALLAVWLTYLGFGAIALWAFRGTRWYRLAR
jgi:hypothetical protein